MSSIMSRRSSSCLVRTLIVLLLQQLSLQAIVVFGPLEELGEVPEEEEGWSSWWILLSLELLK